MDSNIYISSLNYHLLKNRIKKNEGFSKNSYKDKLGYATIGYGHLIKKKEKHLMKKKYNKIFFEELFEKDFAIAALHCQKKFKKFFFNKKTEELIIEMIFQMGLKKVLKFKRMLYYVKKNNKYLASLEMMDSLWYKQTPKRVENLIYNYLKK